MTDYAKLSLTELDQHFKLRLGNLESELGELAKIIVAEEAKGFVRVEMKKHAMLRWSHEINNGDLHPRFVFVFSGYATTIEAAKGLPLSEQARLAEKGFVTVAVIQDGKPIKVKKRLLDLTAEETRQVLHDGKVRSYAAQTPIAEARHQRRKQTQRDTREKVVLDEKAMTVQFFGLNPVVPVAKIIEALHKLGVESVTLPTKKSKRAGLKLVA